MSEGSLSILGSRKTGQDVRSQNVTAALAIANIVKTSLGPVGLDKMLVDDMGDVTITNDGATILKQLEVEHPAARVLVELSNLQDEEVGDGTTSVVILASEILKLANELVKNHVHPTSVISGLLQAKKLACKFIAKEMATKTATLGPDSILRAARTAMSSKIIGHEGDFFAQMTVDAVTRVKVTNSKGKARYPISNINVLKAHGKSARESQLVDGFALNCQRSSQGMPTQVKKAKIALLDIDLRKAKLAMGVQVQVTDPRKLEEIRAKEAAITTRKIQLLLDAGANVVLTTKGIDDQSLKYFVDNKVMAVRRCAKSDLRAIAKATGGQILISLADEEGEELGSVAGSLGEADLVEETRVGDGELIFFRGCRKTAAQTILLRGANDYMLDEIARSLHDALCIVKRTLEAGAVVPGGGAVEAALSVYLEGVADTMGTREQLAVAAFANALLIIPKTLAVNGAYDATDLVAKLRSYHHAAQTNPEKESWKWTGLDLEEGTVRNNLEAGVLEPAISKIKMVRFAIEASVTILRIDDAITMNKANDPQNPVQNPY